MSDELREKVAEAIYNAMPPIRWGKDEMQRRDTYPGSVYGMADAAIAAMPKQEWFPTDKDEIVVAGVAWRRVHSAAGGGRAEQASRLRSCLTLALDMLERHEPKPHNWEWVRKNVADAVSLLPVDGEGERLREALGFLRWLASLDQPDREAERREVTLAALIERAEILNANLLLAGLGNGEGR